MARRKTGRRRGRPRLLNARRRQTTRAGWRGIIDRGSEALRRRKRALTGREDLPLDPAGVLFGGGLIDAVHYSALTQVTVWLSRLACNLGPKGVGGCGRR